MSDYDTDILIWSERQAALLQRTASGDLANSNEIDWPNIVEEIEAVGRSELYAVESLLIQALVHMLKAAAWPLSPYVAHWEAETIGFRDDAARRFTPSMRQRIAVADLYARARRRMPDTIDGQAPLPVPAECPVTLDEMLDLGDPDTE